MAQSDALQILYLVHDLSDAAVTKRVTMLRDGGATVIVAGFKRSSETIGTVAGASAIEFGRTYNGGFMQRIFMIVRAMFGLRAHRRLFENADVVIARNLEMLALAVRGRSLCQPAPVVVYECLDVHRLLLNNGAIGKVLRQLEGWLASRASALLTSSPAFVAQYFNTRSKVRLPIKLIENKVYGVDTHDGKEQVAAPRISGPPWRIGWFGAIRCRKSLVVLAELVRWGEGTIEVVIRGKPSYDQFVDFKDATTSSPWLKYLGAYKNPDDLAAIYGEVHFTWAIDKFEEGLNSSWLLPNRLYEGGLYGSVPIALKSVQTGRTLEALGIGVTLDEPLIDQLRTFFKELTLEQYQHYVTQSLAVPRSNWVFTLEDCRELVSYLRAL